MIIQLIVLIQKKASPGFPLKIKLIENKKKFKEGFIIDYLDKQKKNF